MNQDVFEKIKKTLGEENARTGEAMAEHTSMKVGGAADFYFAPETKEQLALVIKEINAAGDNYYVLGNASNVIIKDDGVRGAIVQLQKYNKISVCENKVVADAGARLKDVAEAAWEAGLTGFEFASGIPGTAGGAACMNAGAYDHEMSEVITRIEALDKNGNTVVFTAEVADGTEKFEFGYRCSGFSDGAVAIAQVEYTLQSGNKDEIRSKMDDLEAQRAAKQPLEYPSCGSVFKRPEGYFAGQLIQDAGMAGARVGGASVSRKHCGFIINDKEGTASNVLGLIKLIQRNVKEKFDVELECEIKVLK